MKVRGPSRRNPSRPLLRAEHDAPDADREVKQTVGIVVVEVAEQDNARSIGGKQDAERTVVVEAAGMREAKVSVADARPHAEARDSHTAVEALDCADPEAVAQ